MSEEIHRRYLRLFRRTFNDAAAYARIFLNFQPYQYQEEFLRDQSPRIAVRSGRQVGKTTVAAIKALHHALTGKDTRTLIVSPGLRQSIILFDRILNLIDSNPSAQMLLKDKTRTRVRFHNGSEMVALPCGRDGATLRGYTADMIILDEANFIPKLVINSVIYPTTITKQDAKRIMISTPWVKDHPFYEALTKPELKFKTYNWPTRLNPAVTKEALELERETIGEYDFNREYNALFMDDQFSYFPHQLVLECIDSYPLYDADGNSTVEDETGVKPGAEYYVGIDFGKRQDHSAIAIIERTADENLRLVYLREFPLGTPYVEVIGTVKRLNEAYAFTRGALDETGVGEPPYEQIREFAPAIKGVTLTAQTKESVMSRLRLLMEKKRLTIPSDDPRLLNQITSQECHPTDSGGLKFAHPPNSHDDLFWAMALAVHSTPERSPVFYAVGARRQL